MDPEYLASLISLQRILDLPWYVGIIGLLLVVMLLWSAFWSVLSFRLIKALIRLVLAIALLVILSQQGQTIAEFVGSLAAVTILGNRYS
jgi:hypothetical protein